MMKKHARLIVLLSFIGVLALQLLFELMIMPIVVTSEAETYFYVAFTTLFSTRMLLSLIAIFVAILAIKVKDRAWGVRLTTVFLSIAVIQLFLGVGSQLAAFVEACHNLQSPSLHDISVTQILESVFYLITLGVFIALSIITGIWKHYLLGFKGLDDIKVALDNEPEPEPEMQPRIEVQPKPEIEAEPEVVPEGEEAEANSENETIDQGEEVEPEISEESTDQE